MTVSSAASGERTWSLRRSSNSASVCVFASSADFSWCSSVLIACACFYGRSTPMQTRETAPGTRWEARGGGVGERRSVRGVGC